MKADVTPWRQVSEYFPGNADPSIANFLSTPQKYMGLDTRRGIPVERWQTCNYSPERKSSYTLDYFFMKSGWTGLDYKDQPIPIAIWYDNEYKLVRTDIRYPVPVEPLFTTDPISIIHDLNYGVAYYIDRSLDNCTVTTIPESYIDLVQTNSPVAGDTAVISRMRNPLEFFYLNNNTYYYRGQDTVRGLPVKVFIGHRSDYVVDLLPDVKFNATFEAYFLSEGWVEIENAGNTVSKSVPIQMNLKLEPYIDGKPIKSVTFNFYDFDFDEEPMSVFDIEPCFPESKKKHIELTFTGKVDNDLLTNKKEFLQESLEMIMLVGNMSPLRIENLKFDYWKKPNTDVHLIYVTATLLPKAPAHAQFRRYIKDGRVGQDAVLKDLTTERRCAEACIGKGYCQSYDWCPIESTCYLSKRHDGFQSVEVHTGCTSGSRPVHVELPPEINLDEAYRQLRIVTYAGGFKLTVPLGKSATREYIAIEINDEIIRKEGASTGVMDIEMFERRSGKQITTSYSYPGISAPDECATACLNQKSFYCQAFTFCPAKGKCLLSTYHPDLVPANYTGVNTACDLFARNFVGRFEKSPGKTVVMKDDWVVKTQVNSEQGCAKECLTYDDFNCKSFDFCKFGETTKCLLGKKHILDVPNKDIESVAICNHYSRNYFDDFEYSHIDTVSLTDGLVVQDIKIQECAKLCIEMLNVTCTGFSFSDDVCFFKGPNLIGSGDFIGTESAKCKIYKRKYFPDASSYTPDPSKIRNTVIHKGHSTALVIGIAISMLLSGVLCGLFAFFLFTRYADPKGRTTSTTGIISFDGNAISGAL
ncbi:uncharacterized protein LOC141899143 [Tubulanus polymorphus]|uniref:uncharacterized protein LOC141899143 n=1 Tax=Tubulanus polymorphus TaxID=672921 RepID=UPI003DA4F2C9